MNEQVPEFRTQNSTAQVCAVHYFCNNNYDDVAVVFVVVGVTRY